MKNLTYKEKEQMARALSITVAELEAQLAQGGGCGGSCSRKPVECGPCGTPVEHIPPNPGACLHRPPPGCGDAMLAIGVGTIPGSATNGGVLDHVVESGLVMWAFDLYLPDEWAADVGVRLSVAGYPMYQGDLYLDGGLFAISRERRSGLPTVAAVGGNSGNQFKIHFKNKTTQAISTEFASLAVYSPNGPLPMAKSS